VAVVLERQRNERRQRAGLEGWQAAIGTGRYAQVRYQTDPVTARRLQRLAGEFGLTAPQFTAAERLTAEELAAPSPTEQAPAIPSATHRPPAPVSVPPSPPPAPNVNLDPPQPQELADTPPPAAGPQRTADEVLNELLGTPDPKPRRRWRRQARRP
jgi:hypothetical protein